MYKVNPLLLLRGFVSFKTFGANKSLYRANPQKGAVTLRTVHGLSPLVHTGVLYFRGSKVIMKGESRLVCSPPCRKSSLYPNR